MRDRNLTTVYGSIILASIVRLGVFVVLFWATVEVETFALKLLLALVASIHIVSAVYRMRTIFKLLKILRSVE